MSRIWSWQPEDMRPDPSRVRGKIRLWRQEWAAAGVEVDRTAALTLPHLLKCLAQCDESTNIGKRDAFMLVLAYCNLHRRTELTDLLVKHVRILPTGLLVTTATSKTDRQAKGVTEFIADRDDIRLIARARAWFAVLKELGADGPDQPVFRALTVTGRLVPRAHATRRGKCMRDGAINERVQLLAGRAGIPYIAGKKARAQPAGRRQHRHDRHRCAPAGTQPARPLVAGGEHGRHRLRPAVPRPAGRPAVQGALGQLRRHHLTQRPPAAQLLSGRRATPDREWRAPRSHATSPPSARAHGLFPLRPCPRPPWSGQKPC